MPTRRHVLAACLGLVPLTSAFAQPLGAPGLPPPGIVPPPGPGIAPPVPRPPRPPTYDDRAYGISEREAVRIARRRGVVDVGYVRRGRNVWIVAGTDQYGYGIRVIVNDDGYVVDVRRD